MSFLTGDKNQALENRKKFARKNDFDENSIVSVNQIHGNKVLKVSNKDGGREIDADGMITNQKGIYLIKKLADCLSIAFYDPKNQAIGLIHAGWQGLDKDIINNVVLQMKRNFRSHSENLIVQFSPSIGPCHYGGPPQLRNTKDPKWKKYIAKDVDENYGIDLWQFAKDQLINLGVLEENIYNPKLCTFESKDYFSHRRSQKTNEPDFRFATMLGIKN
ncbi:peptidoglycan editing factor PgeF [Candidatus Daviesbacteria bacterium]|nr:peptidoglycan editing factor PgeF [Candidatus Daviesbacteria bacterium]